MTLVQQAKPTVVDPHLQTLHNPKSVAVVGASADTQKIGGRLLDYLKRFGFQGHLFPVNPGRNEVQGLRAYRSITDIDAPVDVMLVAVPGQAALDAVTAAAEKGVKAAVIISSGFGEVDDPEGNRLQTEMLAAARSSGMRLIGPNAQGPANFANGAVLSFSVMFGEEEPQDGSVGIVSQSGAMCSVIYGMLRRRGIGVRYAHATGNDADVSAGELGAAVAQDPELKLLILYLEHIADLDQFVTAAAIARERNLPVVVLMGGSSAVGQRAAKAHTGALASESRVMRAFFRRLGMWPATSVREVVDMTGMYLQGWDTQGHNLVIVSNSGAVCVLAADAAERNGLELRELSAETEAALQQVLPRFATTNNPVDITAALLGDNSLFGKVLEIVSREPGADAFLFAVPALGSGYDVHQFARDAAQIVQRTGKPTIVSSSQPKVREIFADHGILAFEEESAAIAALSGFLHHREVLRAARERPPFTISQGGQGTARTLSEADSLARIAQQGIPVPAYRLCRTAEEVVTAVRESGGRVVLKGCSADAPHKSDLGLVALDVRTADQAAEAYERIHQAARSHDVALDGVIVAEMVDGLHEVMVGAHRDRVVGPVVIVGLGGTYVEAVDDVQVLVPPFTLDDFTAAVGRLHAARIFEGVRGEPRADLAAWGDIAMRVGDLITRSPAIESIDLNPILLGGEGHGASAVDALIVETT